MKRNDPGTGKAPSEALHPVIYMTLIGLALWMLLASWSFFTDHGHTGLILGVITLLAVFAVAIPYKLWRIFKRDLQDKGALEDAAFPPFRVWLLSKLRIWRGELKGVDAAIAILLPAAAAATGMTAIALVFHFTTVVPH